MSDSLYAVLYSSTLPFCRILFVQKVTYVSQKHARHLRPVLTFCIFLHNRELCIFPLFSFDLRSIVHFRAYCTLPSIQCNYKHPFGRETIHRLCSRLPTTSTPIPFRHSLLPVSHLPPFLPPYPLAHSGPSNPNPVTGRGGGFFTLASQHRVLFT